MGFQTEKVLQTTDLVGQRPVFSPSEEEQNLITKYYNDFVYDYSIKNQGWEVLNNRTLNTFWTDSNYDYNQTVIQDVNNPVVQYSSGITRDKANTIIISLTQNILVPSVNAFNDKKELDYVVSSVGKTILRWQVSNDGRPSESGKLKSVRATHKQVCEGTVHILDQIGSDGRLTSFLIPNEEVFIPNYYQPNIQLQSHFLWVQQWASYGEAQAEFGHLENFKYVAPGDLGWINQTFAYKERYKALIYQDQCTIVRGWYPVNDEELLKLKKAGKLPLEVKKAKYYNVVINGVNMFEWDNLMPYYHGNYPITKAVFENFSPVEFYWGNSLPNKCAQDKHFRDGWLTLMRYAAKLAAIPALINASGYHIENDVTVPGQMTDMPAGLDPTRIFAVPGTDKGITAGMANLFQMTDAEINRSTAAPQISGQANSKDQTKYETMILQQNSMEILQGLSQQIAFREEARAFNILSASFQFLPRQDIAKLSIPDEVFPDNTSGTLEVIFQKIPPMTPQEKLDKSYQIRQQEEESKKRGENTKQIYLDIDYITKIDFYCEADSDTLLRNNSAFKIAEAEHKWQAYLNAPPGIFNIKPAARNLVRAFGDREKEMIAQQAPIPGQIPGQEGQPGQPALPVPTPTPSGQPNNIQKPTAATPLS